MNQTHRFIVLIGEQLGSDKTIVTDEPGVGVVRHIESKWKEIYV